MKTNNLITNKISCLFFLLFVLFVSIHSSAQVYVTTGNSLGVGISSPAYQVDVQSATPVVRAAISTGTTSYSAFSATDIAASKSVVSLMGGSAMSGTLFGLNREDLGQIYSNNAPLAIGTANGYDLSLGAGNGTVITVKPTGNVGIGTTSPGYALEISTNSAAKPTSSTWTITSDARTKTNVMSYNHGLDLIRQVQLVSYQYNGIANTPAGENGIGVIAQDFQQIFPNSVKPFTISTDSTNAGEEYFGVDLHELFVANVSAVKQLDSLIQLQDSINTVLQSQLIELTNRLNSCCTIGEERSTLTNGTYINKTDIKLTNAQSIILENNVPNPFAEQTAISYYLPDNVQKAQMLFYNSQGRLIQSVDLKEKGKGMINVFASDLSNGVYTYTLVVDGKIIETKKMVKQ